MKRLFYATTLAVALAFAGRSFPADGQPDALLRVLTSEVLATVSGYKDADVRAASKLAKLIELKVEPHFNVTRMTQIAMAENWTRATPEQQKALTAEFRTLLIHTYSTVLSNYRNQSIEFTPLEMAPADVKVTVKSIMKQPGTNPLKIDYQMANTPAGWKVYEITVDGVNLIANYRGTFAARIREGGVDHLINSLRDKNRQNQPA